MNEFSCEAQDLAVGYGKAPLAEHIALGVRPGQILTLIGPNGAGKSTLLKTLAGQLAPMGGAVLLDGQDLTAYTGSARAQRLALMLPHTRRTELTTCFEFAAAGRIPYTGRLGLLSEADRQAVRDALALVGASALAERDFNCISDGQRQRILLARAICQQPEVILLDEPTSFLDIKGKIELLSILQTLAHTQHLAVLVSLHELDMAQKIADAVVCVSPQSVSGVLTPQEAFAPENIQTLYRLSREQYETLFGPPKPAKPRFEHYVRSGQKLLRCGYTTGTCAALGAAGAARLLLTGKAPETVALRTPKGIVVEVAPLFCRRAGPGAECAIEKDGGDDVDVTTGLPIVATVELLPGTTEVRIAGGPGVGRVTRPGLDQPVGEAAINHVPRRMIAEALQREAETACYTGGFADPLHSGRRRGSPAHLQPPHRGRGRAVHPRHQRHRGAHEPAGHSGHHPAGNEPGGAARPNRSQATAAHPGPRQLWAGLPWHGLPGVCFHPGRQDLQFHRRHAGYGRFCRI